MTSESPLRLRRADHRDLGSRIRRTTAAHRCGCGLILRLTEPWDILLPVPHVQPRRRLTYDAVLTGDADVDQSRNLAKSVCGE